MGVTVFLVLKHSAHRDFGGVFGILMFEHNKYFLCLLEMPMCTRLFVKKNKPRHNIKMTKPLSSGVAESKYNEESDSETNDETTDESDNGSGTSDGSGESESSDESESNDDLNSLTEDTSDGESIDGMCTGNITVQLTVDVSNKRSRTEEWPSDVDGIVGALRKRIRRIVSGKALAQLEDGFTRLSDQLNKYGRNV